VSATATPAPAPTPTVKEGTFSFKGYPVWYRVVGAAAEAPGQPPLLCLHGGPGAGWDYLQPFDDLAATGRQVIFYDQLGCGHSTIAGPHDPDMWTVDLFVEEVDAIRQELGLDRVHLLGQSWGGMLAMQYAIGQPDGLLSLIVESSPASIAQWVSEANRLRSLLPHDVEEVLRQHEAAGTTDSDAYKEAVLVFYRRHVCRLDPWPDYVERTFAQLEANPEVYNAMNGPSEFHVVGTLLSFDITPQLGQIAVPTLLLSGLHDEATPVVMQTVQSGINGSEWVLFEKSSHMCHAEERDRCMAIVNSFLTGVDAP
jgi:L-proline amide hydrolase